LPDAQTVVPQEPTYTEPVFTGFGPGPVKKKKTEEELEAEAQKAEAQAQKAELAMDRQREKLRKSVERLEAEMRARIHNKIETEKTQLVKEEANVFKVPFGKLQALSAVFSLAAFPVHIWGYTLNIDPFLLIFPFSFSVLWLAYSHKKSN